MAARAMWKATVEVGNIEIPIKLYSAIQDSTVRFRLLDARDETPVKQQMVNSASEVELAPDSEPTGLSPDSTDPADVVAADIRKGAPIGPGRVVVLSDEEIASIEPQESRRVEVFRFIPLGSIDHAYYNRAYWLGPDGEAAAYWALVEALSERKREGVARWVMRKHAYVGAIRVRDEHLLLQTLRHTGEVVEPAEIEISQEKAPTPRELDMARQLVGMLEDTFDPHAYHDEYRDRVLELIERKTRGESPRPVPPALQPTTSSLTDALEQSILAAGGRPRTRRRGKAARG
jgi:DNA end-binding protein Ku